jgi:hypothetical protein
MGWPATRTDSTVRVQREALHEMVAQTDRSGLLETSLRAPFDLIGSHEKPAVRGRPAPFADCQLLDHIDHGVRGKRFGTVAGSGATLSGLESSGMVCSRNRVWKGANRP